MHSWILQPAYLLPKEPILETSALGWDFLGSEGASWSWCWMRGGTWRTIMVPAPKKLGEILALIFPTATQKPVAPCS